MPTSPFAGESSPSQLPHELQCMEIIGGNRAVHECISSPGLDVWLDSRPCGGGAGGDIHYFSMCGSGRVTRLAVADVAGHGRSIDEMAQWLRRLMRKHINLLDQTEFARAVNREFTQMSDNAVFATLLLITYFAPTDHLIICNAGHPRPIWYSTRQHGWMAIDPAIPDPGPSITEAKGTYRLAPVANLPLGIIEPTDYHQFAVKLDVGDLVLIYTDALIEARSPDSRQMTEAGLLNLVQSIGPVPADELGRRVLEGVDRWRGGAAPEDDQTLMVLHHNAADPPPLTLGRLARSLVRMIGLEKV